MSEASDALGLVGAVVGGVPTIITPSYTSPSTLGASGLSAGRVPIKRPGNEPTRLDYGRERLFQFYNKLSNLTPANVALVGDSNTASYAGAQLQTLLSRVPFTTSTNYGVSGTTVLQWKNNTNGFSGTGKDMASVLATNPDLLVICFGGTNDPFYGGTAASFIANLNATLAAIRASANGAIGKLGIVLCTSATQNDATVYAGTSDMRDEYFNVQVRAGILAAAEKYQCAFFDKASRYPDASVDFPAGTTGVNTWLDSARVHTIGAFQYMLARDLFEWLIPSVFRVDLRANVASAAGFAQPGTAENLIVIRNENVVLLQGYISGPGTPLASGRQIGTIPAGWKPLAQAWQISALIYDGTLPMEQSYANVADFTTNGAITMAVATTKAASRIYLRATWMAA